MTFRSTPENTAIRERLEADVAQWLAQGNKPEKLPGFGMAPKISEIDGRRFALHNEGNVNKLDDFADAGIKADLLSGMGTVEVARKWKVGTTTVTRRKDILIARGEL